MPHPHTSSRVLPLSRNPHVRPHPPTRMGTRDPARPSGRPSPGLAKLGPLNPLNPRAHWADIHVLHLLQGVYSGLMGIKCLACWALRLYFSDRALKWTRVNGKRVLNRATYVDPAKGSLQNSVALLCGSVIFSARHLIPMRLPSISTHRPIPPPPASSSFLPSFLAYSWLAPLITTSPSSILVLFTEQRLDSGYPSAPAKVCKRA